MSGNPIEILSKIRLAGGIVTAEGGDLRISAPAGLLSDQERAVLAEHRSQLVELLDPEPMAVGWVEALDPVERDRLADQAAREWDRHVDDEAELDALAERLFASGGPVHISVVVQEVLASVGIEAEVEEITETTEGQCND